jgi:hypothetical protein
MDTIIDTLSLIINMKLESTDSQGKHFDEYRCHEAARAISQELTSLGIENAVKDGVVVYDIRSFFEKNLVLSCLLDKHRPEVKKALIEQKKKMNIIHSWCEVYWEGFQNRIIVDFLPKFPLGGEDCIGCSWLVGYEKNIPHQYCPVAVRIGRLIIFTVMPPKFVLLRVP